MRISLLVSLILTLLLASKHLLASQWVEGEASMVIGDAPLDAIREMTIKNAIADASFRAGSMITAEEIVLNGLLVGSKAVLQTQGIIRNAQVISESIAEDILTVKVKVNIAPGRQCKQSKYGKRIVINQFHLNKPQDAAIGSLFEFGQHISKRIQQQLAARLEQSTVNLLDNSFDHLAATQGIEAAKLLSKSQYIANKYGAQYLLFGVIRDLSVFNRVKKKLLGEEVNTRRSFTIRVYLLDVFRHSLVLEESYHTEADWHFELTEEVDMNSSLFWQSDYGRAVLGTINQAVTEVDDIVSCRPSLAQIIDITPHGYLINLGQQHGLQEKDSFILNKVLSSYASRPATSAFIRPVPDSQMQVIALNEKTALIDAKGINSAVTATLYDLVSP